MISNLLDDTRPIKRKADVPWVSNENCSLTYQTKFKRVIQSTQICAGGGSKDTCGGDSGGPLMSLDTSNADDDDRWYIEGVTSYGSVRCGEANVPAIYARVLSYLDWIQDNMKP